MLVKEVAARANLTVSEVNRQIKIGKLKATLNKSVIPVRNEITEEDYQHWQVTRRKHKKV